jgi:hypothetical protein
LAKNDWYRKRYRMCTKSADRRYIKSKVKNAKRKKRKKKKVKKRNASGSLRRR